MSIQKIFEGNPVFGGVLFHPVIVPGINFLNSKEPLNFFIPFVQSSAFRTTFDLMAKGMEVRIVCVMIDLVFFEPLDQSRSYGYRRFFRIRKGTGTFHCTPKLKILVLLF